ncbi:ATP-binding protein [Streptomyces sp. NPDC051940]|uniref:ATP-binding protein n=1 Tax=Streptomyces sp. NPDC051940 TaxID=3155675 RepID=UPI003447AFC4
MTAPLQEWLRAPGSATCELPADPRSIAVARSVVRSVLCEWDLEPLADNVVTATSELVTNALRHGMPIGPGPDAHPLTLGLMRRGSSVVCAVFDRGTEIPQLSEPDPLAESGRGLHIVASVSDVWGWSRPTPSGKAVWAIFSAAADAAPAAAVASRPGPSHGGPGQQNCTCCPPGLHGYDWKLTG